MRKEPTDIERRAMIDALSEWVKQFPDLCRQMIRNNLIIEQKFNQFVVNGHATGISFVIKQGGRYKRTVFAPGEKLAVKSLYIGKRGDVIFTFTLKAVDANYNDQIEIKLHDAATLLDGFLPTIYNIFDNAELHRMFEHRKNEDQRQEKERIAAEKAAKEAAEQAKRDRYKSRAAFGSW